MISRSALSKLQRCTSQLITSRVGRKVAVQQARFSTSTLSHANLVTVTGNQRCMSSLSAIADTYPHMDAIRYEHKNMKWTFSNVNDISDALASGLLEIGLVKGDAILSWLPSHFAEQHALQFTCAKAGFVLYTLDPSIATTDPDLACAQLAKALEETNAVALIQQEAGSDVDFINLVKKVIPELNVFDQDSGMQFFTPRFPNLRLPVHTGMDRMDGKYGLVPYRHLMLPNGVSPVSPPDTPLYGELVFNDDNLPTKGKLLSSDEVLKQNVWPSYTSILNQSYTEVPGVGVVF